MLKNNEVIITIQYNDGTSFMKYRITGVLALVDFHKFMAVMVKEFKSFKWWTTSTKAK